MTKETRPWMSISLVVVVMFACGVSLAVVLDSTRTQPNVDLTRFEQFEPRSDQDYLVVVADNLAELNLKVSMAEAEGNLKVGNPLSKGDRWYQIVLKKPLD